MIKMELVDIDLNRKIVLLSLSTDEIDDMIQGINAMMSQGECSISGGNETCNWLRDNILIHFER